MAYAEKQVNWKIILEGFFCLMEHELNRKQETTSEARFAVGGVALKGIKRKAKSKSSPQLKAFLQTYIDGSV